MKIIRHILPGSGIVAIPLLVAFPVVVFPTTTATPREILMAQVRAALEAQEGMSPAIGVTPALIAAVLLLGAVTWFVFRRRPAEPRIRLARSTRAEHAVDLLRGGESSERVMVRAQVSRDAIELLRRMTIGQPAT